MQVIIKDLNKSDTLGMTTYGGVFYMPDAKMYENVELIYNRSYDVIETIRAKHSGIPDYTYYEFTAINMDSKSIIYRRRKSSPNLFIKAVNAGDIKVGDKILVKCIFSSNNNWLDHDKYDLDMKRLIKLIKVTRNPESCK